LKVILKTKVWWSFTTCSWCVLPQDDPKRIEIRWSWSFDVLLVKLHYNIVRFWRSLM